LRLHRVVPSGVGIALLLGLLASAIPAQSASPRILGGIPVQVQQAPWQVQVAIRNQELCGGAILSATIVLTAAHCVDQGRTPADIRVTAGTSRIGPGGIERRVLGITIHPTWDRNTYRNDIALLTLDSPLPTTVDVSPVRLPEVPEPWPAAGTPATVTGWGSSLINGTLAEVLQRADVFILAGPGDPICGGYGGLFDPVSQICAGVTQGGVDACQGDSGGALVIETELGPTIAGIVSSGRDCGDAEFPGLYTRVSTYRSWLQALVVPQGMSPSAPQSVTARSPRTGRVRVSWQPPSADGGKPVTEYQVSVGRQSCRTATTSCVFSKLRKGARLTARVTAVNEVGLSPVATVPVRVR
jgi:secreted trypsin-like serine protease